MRGLRRKRTRDAQKDHSVKNERLIDPKKRSWLVFHRGHACVVVRSVSVSRMTRPRTRARTSHVRAFAMEYFPSHAGGDRAVFAGKTLVLPAVGHGNVGQLAVDLMIQTLVVDRLVSGKSRLGCLDHPSVLPCVGTEPFAPIGGNRGTTNGGNPVPTPGPTNGAGPDRSCRDPGRSLATALELHGDETALPGVVFLQLRGDVVSGGSNRFAIDLADFIETCAFSKVVILASLPSTAQNGSFETIGDTRFRHARVVEKTSEVSDTSNRGETIGATFAFATDEDLRWTHLGACNIEPDSVPTDAPDKFSLPPWSLLRALARVSSSRKNTQGEKIAPALDVSCLVAVCSEGDNSDDAARAAETTSLFLEIQGARSHDVQEESFGRSGPLLRETWSVPSSWRGAYGRGAAKRAMFA